MKIQSARFGTIEVPEKFILHFPDGIAPFGRNMHFGIIAPEQGAPTAWLQSCELSELAFWVGHVARLFPDRDFHLRARHLKGLRVDAGADLSILAILTVHDERVTANLLAPLVVNNSLGLGRQVITTGNTDLIRTPVDMHRIQATVAK